MKKLLKNIVSIISLLRKNLFVQDIVLIFEQENQEGFKEYFNKDSDVLIFGIV